MVTAPEYFNHLIEWQVVICKQCQHAVWPEEVRGHLQGKQHRISRKEADAVADEIEQWPGIIHYRGEFNVPSRIDEPIPELPLYTDGFQCRLDTARCSYICRDEKTLKKHWHIEHNWSIRQKRGGSVPDRKKANKRRFQQGARRVYCQRFFPSRHGSQYFEIREPKAATAAQAHIETNEVAWAQAWKRVNEYWNTMQEDANKIIKPGEIDEANPWLQRTGWIEFLKGCDREELLHSIREPNAEEDDEEEPIEAAIWQAMGEIAAISQRSVKQSGVMLRLEAIRTEMHQTQYHPLQPYQDEKTIKDHCRPWQQMLMFIVRTQREHEWKSPAYKFTRWQFKAYRRLIAAVENVGEEGVEEEIGEEIGEEVEEGGGGEQDPEREGIEERTIEESRSKAELTPVQAACLDFCVELLNQKIHNREYEMPLVCASAVLGIHPTQGGFRDPESYPPILSRIIKIAHFIVVEKAVQIARPADDNDMFNPGSRAYDFDDSGYESESPNRSAETSEDEVQGSQRRTRRYRSRCRRGRSSFEWVQEMMNHFMVRGTGCAIQWFLDLRSYGLKIHYNTTAVGHVNWKDKYTLEYKTLHCTMDEFRGMVHQLVESTRKALFEDVLFGGSRKGMPIIPWDKLHDDPTNGEVGWNFIHDQRNQLPVNGQAWLFERVQSQPHLHDRFVRTSAADQLDHERIRDWMRQVARFRGLLLILMHISGGQPARGPEILSVRHRNTPQGGHRNMFIEDGTVVFVTKYHKGYQMSGDAKIIHRYLPRQVGELVVWYLWLALPFIQRIEAAVWKKKGMSDHMWPADADGPKWTTDRMKKQLQQVSAEALGQPIHVAAYREIAIAISRQWVRGATAFPSDDGDENQEWNKENTMADTADIQAGHSPHIAGAIYARESIEMAGSTADRRRQFRAVSTDWQRFLGFESAQIKTEKADSKRKRCTFEDDADEERIERRVRLSRMNATTELQRMMRAEVSFRSVQGEAIEAIQKGQSPVVAVMPTGSGKSVLFMLPAWVEPGGVTIVVVPLRGLRKDMLYRCSRIGIRCAVWDGRIQPDGASIVLVTPEKATSEAFGTFVQRIRHTRRLDRIVVDECHTILNDQLNFRKHLQQVGKLAIAETQMVLLTATLPPTETDELFKRMYWKREEVHLIRASTVRSNIQYSVVDGHKNRGEQETQLERIVEEVLQDPTHPEGKVVIMCESKPKIQRIVDAGLFVCEPYHADLPEEKGEEVLDGFREGHVRVIAATGAFGMGIDIANIRLVIHVDNPRNMLDYGQASGRAGRDGFPSRAVIIRGGLEFEDPRVQQYIDPQRRECRRIDIDRYLDGDESRTQCAKDEAPCDICQSIDREPAHPFTVLTPPTTQAPDVTPAPSVERSRVGQTTQAPGAEGVQVPERHEIRTSDRIRVQVQDRERRIPEARRIQQVQTAAIGRNQVEQQLERWKGVCVVCYRVGTGYHHSITTCPSTSSHRINEERKLVQRTIRFARGIACFKCGVPQTICERWDGYVDTRRNCQFFGMLVGVVYAIKYVYPKVWAEWIERARRRNVAVDTESEIRAYLGLEAKGAELDSVQLLQAFMWMTRSIESSAV